jgi:hypothetical protein
VPIELRHTNSNHLGVMSRRSVERMCAVLRKRLNEADRFEGESVPVPDAPSIMAIASKVAAE